MTQPNQRTYYALYEARRLQLDGAKSADLRREDGRGIGLLHGWAPQYMTQNPDDPHFLTTVPRDGRSGLPHDWSITVTGMYFASSVGIEGRLWLEQNDDTVKVMDLDGESGVDDVQPKAITRLAGPTGSNVVADKFEMRLAGTIADAQAIDMAPIHRLATALLFLFDKAHPGWNQDRPGSYLLKTHRAHLEHLRRLPPGPWIVAGISGPAQIVIV